MTIKYMYIFKKGSDLVLLVVLTPLVNQFEHVFEYREIILSNDTEHHSIKGGVELSTISNQLAELQT